ncbi:hypothetical protein [Bacillus cereus group sp. N12]|nr:hypothetical protein [Bacillus cereus group sp. N12]
MRQTNWTGTSSEEWYLGGDFKVVNQGFGKVTSYTSNYQSGS